MVKARRVGNSITVTIPADLVCEMAITEDTDMNVFVREDAIVFQPTKSRWDRLVNEVRKKAAAQGLTEADVQREVDAVRHPAPKAEGTDD